MEARSKGRKKQSWVFAIVGEEEKGSKWELGNGKKEVESREFVGLSKLLEDGDRPFLLEWK